MNKLIGVLSIIAFIVVALAATTWLLTEKMDMNNVDSHMNTASEVPKDESNANGDQEVTTKKTTDVIPADTKTTEVTTDQEAISLIQPKEGQPIKEFSLIAQESTLEVKQGFTIPVWTYGDTVPGIEIRVTQGDFVRVNLKNELTEPVTIHWHGYPVLSAMDGIPGFTQDSVLPGETFTYEFSADYTGTYWYHSHQESSKQVDKGLYGALIVEPKEQAQTDKDFTLILDEWMEKPEEGMGAMTTGSSDGSMTEMSGMSQDAGDPVAAEEVMMSKLYNIYTVNGKSGELINPLEVFQGDVVRLRFINAGYRSHGIHIPGQDIKVISTDGQDITGASVIKDQVILIAPGERYDVEFTAQSDNFIIDAHDNNLFNDQIKIPVIVKDGSGEWMTETSSTNYTLFDFKDYGTAEKGEFDLNQTYDIDQMIELNTDIKDGAVRYTINGKVFSELPPLLLQTGNLVKLTYENKSTVDHPMHLHGHFFQVLSKNGELFSGATILKDTLLIKPGEKYVVAFKADNPGIWVQHCHELHHAAGGMMQKVIYTDYVSSYTADPNNTNNKAE